MLELVGWWEDFDDVTWDLLWVLASRTRSVGCFMGLENFTFFYCTIVEGYQTVINLEGCVDVDIL